MNLPRKIKSYFAHYGFHSWSKPDWKQNKNSFRVADQDTLLDLTAQLLKWKEADSPGKSKLRMELSRASVFENLDQLMPWLQDSIRKDSEETLTQSREHGWEFLYFPDNHPSCKESFCIWTGITSIKKPRQYCRYIVASVRKFEGKYYAWSPVTQDQPSLNLRRLR